MKKYPHIISKLFYEPLIITRAKHAALVRVLDAHMAGAFAEPIHKAPDDEEPDQHGYSQGNGTAIIPVHGTISKHIDAMEAESGGCDLTVVDQAIDIAMSDAGVNTLVFDFRSPGGAVTGVPETGRKIAGIVSKKTVAFTDSECCSGALWLASQCQHFYATESAAIGSIGVWCAIADLSAQLDKEGINIQEISAGKYKTMGAYWKPLTKEEKGMIQAHVDKTYAQFKEAVNNRRQVADEFMQGQIFDGEEAVAAGLVDGLVDGIEDVI